MSNNFFANGYSDKFAGFRNLLDFLLELFLDILNVTDILFEVSQTEHNSLDEVCVIATGASSSKITEGT